MLPAPIILTLRKFVQRFRRAAARVGNEVLRRASNRKRRRRKYHHCWISACVETVLRRLTRSPEPAPESHARLLMAAANA